VLRSEPPPDDDPLVRAWRDPGHPAHHRVVLTPHCAFYSEESRRECRTKAALTCLRAISGEPIPNVVN
jgi:lactate dehydrogenase-like 2-hydroxyacid dehydrogenase